jgi:acetyltransferase-like isoleucine patch superfamily enzyme
MCTINTTAFILPLSKIEDGATVGAESLVLRKVKAGQTVMGVPAKPLVVPQIKKPE